MKNKKTRGPEQFLEPVYETLARVKQELPGTVTLLGFCGAPWTLATYIAGGGTVDQFAARSLHYQANRGARGGVDSHGRPMMQASRIDLDTVRSEWASRSVEIARALLRPAVHWPRADVTSLRPRTPTTAWHDRQYFSWQSTSSFRTLNS